MHQYCIAELKHSAVRDQRAVDGAVAFHIHLFDMIGDCELCLCAKVVHCVCSLLMMVIDT
jgi:hypothetical protein